MYYFVKFTWKDEELAKDPNFTFLPSEWVVEADSKEDAIKQIKDDTELDEILEIREISVEERIQRERDELFEMVKREYTSRRYANKSIKECANSSEEMENNLELQYLAIKEFNAKQRLTRRLSRQEGFNELTIAEFNKKVAQLLIAIDANNEEEFNKVLNSVQKN